MANSDNWYTSNQVLDCVESFFGGPIGLDPTGSPHSLVAERAEFVIDEMMDCLAMEWPKTRTAFQNCPYSNPSVFIDRFIDQRDLVDQFGQAECVLVNCCTSTRWCQKLLKWGDYACFPSPRLRFLRPRKSEEEIWNDCGQPTDSAAKTWNKYAKLVDAENKLDTVEIVGGVELVLPPSPRYDNLIVGRGLGYGAFYKAFRELGFITEL